RISEEMDAGATRPKMVKDYVGWGAGPRASEYLVLAAKAKALLSAMAGGGGAAAGHVTPEHVKAVAKPVLRHRGLPNFNAEADQVDTDMIVQALVGDIPVDSASADERRQMNAVVR